MIAGIIKGKYSFAVGMENVEDRDDNISKLLNNMLIRPISVCILAGVDECPCQSVGWRYVVWYKHWALVSLACPKFTDHYRPPWVLWFDWFMASCTTQSVLEIQRKVQVQ